MDSGRTERHPGGVKGFMEQAFNLPAGTLATAAAQQQAHLAAQHAADAAPDAAATRARIEHQMGLQPGTLGDSGRQVALRTALASGSLAILNALPVTASGRAQLLPAGEFSARDGRPGPGKFWRLTNEGGRALAAKVGAMVARSAMSIDYEHQTILSAKNGQPAPAAGWITSVAWQDGLGLFADVRWTPRARALIQADEYRYISPVIQHGADMAITGLYNAALVSTPALLGMDAVTA